MSTSQDKSLASQELKKDICIGQELKREISDIKAAQSEFEKTIRHARQLKGVLAPHK
jgi:hypothetical protein